jgi:hypothetical protein
MIGREENGGFDYFFGWAALLFFGLGILIGLKQLFSKQVQIEIDENGIWDKSLKFGKIDLKYIKGAYPISVMDSHFISLILEKEYESKISQYEWSSKINQEIGAQKVNLNLAHIKADKEKISEIVNKLAKMDFNERRKYLKNVAQQHL